MKLLSVFFSAFITISVDAQKTYHWKEATSNGYTYRYVTGDPMKARFYTLKNGLTVIFSVNKKTPRVQTLIGVRAGSNQDPAAYTGLAHYLEHLLFKGSEKFGTQNWKMEKPLLEKISDLYSKYNGTADATERKKIYHNIDSISGEAAKYAIPNEYDKLMVAIGSQGSNAHTFVDETIYKEDIPSNAIDKFLIIQAERFRAPVFRLFHTELEVVYEEKNTSLDSDASKLFETAFAALFPTHNYGQQTTIGIVDHLKNPNQQAIRQFFNDYYVPNNMALVMVGDLDPDEVIKSVDKHFSYMKPKPVKEYKPVAEAPIKTPIVKEVFGPDAESVSIFFRMPGALDVTSQPILRVMKSIFCNGTAGLLDLNINKQQKALSANADLDQRKDYSIFTFQGQANEGQTLEEVKSLLLAQLELLKLGKFDESLIKAIVNNTKLGELRGLEGNNSRATRLMDDFIKSAGQNRGHQVALIGEMNALTKKQIVDFANKYIQENYVVVYKRKGADKMVQKIEKPAITPIEVNRDAQSTFFNMVNSLPVTSFKPVWLDYKKDIQTTDLGNTAMLYVQNKDNSLFNLYYRYDIGTFNNKKLGLAAAYLQYLGTDKYTSTEIDKLFFHLACNFGVDPGGESTTVAVSGLQENFDKAVILLEHLMANCRPDEKALTALKEQIIKVRSDSKLNKDAISSGLVNYAIFGAENPFNYTLSEAELNAVTASELVDILHELSAYRHKVIYWGPQTLTAAAADIKKIHPLPLDFRTAPAAIQFKQLDQHKNQVFFADYDMLQAEVHWLRCVGVYDAGKSALLDVFNSYFGFGMSSLVNQHIREAKALAYSTYAYIAEPNKKDLRYTFDAFVGTQMDKMNDATAGMGEMLNSLPRVDELINSMKKSIKQGIETERITGVDIVFSYLDALKLGHSNDIRRQKYESIDSVSFDALQQYHKENLVNKPYNYCIIGSGKNIKTDDLRKYGDLKKLTLTEIFGF